MKRSLCACLLVLALTAPAARAIDEQYNPGPDAQRHDGVPQGKLTQHKWTSKIFEGTERDYWVYVPAQYDGNTPACLMVFQDGKGYADEKGAVRVPIVFDNLIAKGEMPVTIGLFINPGTKPAATPGGRPVANRSFEYDTLSDQYARFLIEEMLPELAKQYKITDDPKGRAVCGASSGGICAFTVAWNRPDAFSKVVSHIGSFTNIRGGHNYPPMIRKTQGNPKPIRVFLQDGSNDLDNAFGNWFLANQEMAAALKFAGYDYKTEWGEGHHSNRHGGAIFPDTLRWIWRDYKKS